jgi:hypothetical protein
MLKDSRVLEQLDTKSVVDLTSSSRYATEILVKLRPFGRPTNRHTAGMIPPNILKDPVSLGEVEGVFHTSAAPPPLRVTKARSSRRGKEQMRSKISREVEVRRSDLRVGDNPWNGTRETRWIFRTKAAQMQVHEVVKGADPTTHAPICGGDDREAVDEDTARVVSGGFGRIRKRLLPQLGVGF